LAAVAEIYILEGAEDVPIHDNFLIQNKIEKGGSIQINVDDYLSLMELLETSNPRIAPGGWLPIQSKGSRPLAITPPFLLGSEGMRWEKSSRTISIYGTFYRFSYPLKTIRRK
jgi:hypothetical protein